MKRILKFAVVIIGGRLPGRVRALILNRLFGWDIHPSARIGLSLIDVDQLTMARGAYIGHLNVIRDLHILRMGERGHIGQWNWISASRPLRNADAREGGVMEVGNHAAITSRHYVDVSGGVSVGSFSTIAGVRSSIISHQIDTQRSIQTTAPVSIGAYCFIGSDTRIAPGAVIPDRCVVAMGAVIVGHLPDADTLYGGVPARPIKSVLGGEYFHRTAGRVWLERVVDE